MCLDIRSFDTKISNSRSNKGWHSIGTEQNDGETKVASVKLGKPRKQEIFLLATRVNHQSQPNIDIFGPHDETVGFTLLASTSDDQICNYLSCKISFQAVSCIFMYI